MPPIKIRRDEMEIVNQAATRLERRSNFRFVIDQNKIEITDEEPRQPSLDTEGEDTNPPVAFD